MTTKTESTSHWTRVEKVRVLRFASALTVDACIPEAVMVNAQVLYAWLAEAEKGSPDRYNRLSALEQANDNRPHPRRPDDDPARLISEAEPYYEFLKAA